MNLHITSGTYTVCLKQTNADAFCRRKAEVNAFVHITECFCNKSFANPPTLKWTAENFSCPIGLIHELNNLDDIDNHPTFWLIGKVLVEKLR